MLLPPPEWFLPLFALYPEIHYRFRFFPFSRYYRRQPEIIADAPRRLEPGQALPVLLLIKDAHHFPFRLDAVNIAVRARDRLITKLLHLSQPISDHWWHHLEWLELPDESPVNWEVSVVFEVNIRGRGYRVANDNLPGLSHAPLTVAQSGQALPRRDGWHFGDLHAHTAYTEDQVEFGAPLSAYPVMGLAQGLSFALAADHSYDLDNSPDSFSRNDPQLRRFQQREEALDRLNDQYKNQFALLPGFELSAANARKKNIHLLLLGQRDFLPGSGDSAERWFSTRSELSVRQALQKMNRGSLSIAAHPMVVPPLLQSLFLGRGKWETSDLDDPDLSGLQIWNGENSGDFRRGVERWVQGLLSGKRWKIVAGSDAHGNFNRYRQVGFPLWRLAESDRHVFGQMRTGMYLPETMNCESILAGLRHSRSLISDGPFADLRAERDSGGVRRLVAQARSTPEFGGLSEVRVLWGQAGERAERILLEETLNGDYTWEWPLAVQDQQGYLRVEVGTQTGRRCLTNPLFLSDPPP